MTFINEIPSEGDFAEYNLSAFAVNNVLAEKHKLIWTVDRDKNYYLWGGVKGNPAGGEDFYGCFDLYLDGDLCQVYLTIGEVYYDFRGVLAVRKWGHVYRISINGGHGRYDLPRSIWHAPDEPQVVFSGMTLNHFLMILKEALGVNGLGDGNRYMPRPIVVEFGF